MVKAYSRFKKSLALGVGFVLVQAQTAHAGIHQDANSNRPEIQIVEAAETCPRRLANAFHKHPPGSKYPKLTVPISDTPAPAPMSLAFPESPSAPPISITRPADLSVRVRRLTLNNMGYEATSPDTWDPITKLWIRYGATTIKTPPRLLLNVGCAFGSTSVSAASAGAKVICNDLDERHLTALSVSVPEDLKAQFIFLPGDYCAECTMQDLQRAGSVDGVLLSRVLHFFSPRQFQRALQISFELLRPKGRIFVVTSSPYLKSLLSLGALFEFKKMRGDLWPGFLDGTKEKVSDYFPRAKNRYPESMNFVDPEILTRELELAGFTIRLPAHYLNDVALPQEHLLDGRELVGIVGEKL